MAEPEITVEQANALIASRRSGAGSPPLIIVAVVVAMLTTLTLARARGAAGSPRTSEHSP